MSNQHPGPLDKCRTMIAEAEEMDQLARQHEDQEWDMYDVFSNAVFELTDQNPLMNQEVIVYGRQLTMSAGDEGLTPFVSGPDEGGDRVKGMYSGLAVLLVYDSATDTESLRVAHMIYTGSSDAVFDKFGHKDQKHFYEYVCVQGSDLEPVQPANGHSLEELADDAVTAEIDKISFDEASGLHEKISRICACMNKVLERTAYLEDDLNHQRISYINSLGLFAGTSVFTRDLLLADKETYLTSGQILFTDMARSIEILPYRIDAAPGYRRGRRPEDVTFEPCPELFVAATLTDGQPVMAPLSNIERISKYGVMEST